MNNFHSLESIRKRFEATTGAHDNVGWFFDEWEDNSIEIRSGSMGGIRVAELCKTILSRPEDLTFIAWAHQDVKNLLKIIDSLK